jgi:O-acetyl-ADP-ribose deacetylase (regulator of RNase III)
MRERLEVVLGDITTIKADAIVNAANAKLTGGGGVDGAIHRAAGPELLQECLKLGGCTTGKCKLTKGYKLPAKHVIHAVGPVWEGGTHGEEDLLAACYHNSLSLAVLSGVKSIAFPSISTGAYRFPLPRAVKIAVTSVRKFLETDASIKKVIFVCYDKSTQTAYNALIEQMIPA